MKKTEINNSNMFIGFQENIIENFWPYPNFMEEYWYQMSGSEQKVLDFIMRQTIGFRKTSDWIAISQFTNGIGKANKGTGLSKSQVQRAIIGLEKKGFITVKRHKNRPSIFRLVYEDDQYRKNAPIFSEKDLTKAFANLLTSPENVNQNDTPDIQNE